MVPAPKAIPLATTSISGFNYLLAVYGFSSKYMFFVFFSGMDKNHPAESSLPIPSFRGN